MPRSWFTNVGYEVVEPSGHGNRQGSDELSVVHAVPVWHALREPDERTSTGLPQLLPAKAPDAAAENVERLIGAVVDVTRSREPSRMKELHHRQCPPVPTAGALIVAKVPRNQWSSSSRSELTQDSLDDRIGPTPALPGTFPITRLVP